MRGDRDGETKKRGNVQYYIRGVVEEEEEEEEKRKRKKEGERGEWR